jgi:hypothetical protein
MRTVGMHGARPSICFARLTRRHQSLPQAARTSLRLQTRATASSWSGRGSSGCFVFVNGGDADDGRPDLNHHPRFNIVESSLAAWIKTEVQIVLDVLVMVSPETADRKGGHLD